MLEEEQELLIKKIFSGLAYFFVFGKYVDFNRLLGHFTRGLLKKNNRENFS
jgi:hypothetical protein